MTKEPFLSADYKTPDTSNYFKFKEGKNKFRILSKAITGYEYWTDKNKPVRSRAPFEGIPSDMKKDSKMKHFWAFVVWNYDSNKVQICEVTQASIRDAIHALANDDTWGDPFEYDITITKKGEGLETEYTIMPNPKTPLVQLAKDSYEQKAINLEALYDGGDPFALK